VGAPLAGVDRRLENGDEVPLDDGAMFAVATPGHARHHLAFHHRRDSGKTAEKAGPEGGSGGDLFVGDLLLGVGRTTWVGEYSGCLADYLASLDRVERLNPDRIFPAHGPVLERPLETVAAFREHRRSRIVAVERALADLGAPPRPGGEGEVWPLVDLLVREVYGGGLEGKALVGARWSVRAILEYLGVAPFPPEGAPSEGGGRLAPGT
jgi:glyoxylase-like metal-dependent hydrolase (beta-lactamase superfamily II)